MGKIKIKNVIIHNVSTDTHDLHEKLSEFHEGVIKRRISGMSISKKQKIQVIDKVIEILKVRDL